METKLRLSVGFNKVIYSLPLSSVCFLFIIFINTSPGGVEDVFFSMADMDMSHSLSSLPPLGEPPTVDLDLSLTSNYSASPGESPSANATVSPNVCCRMCVKTIFSEKKGKKCADWHQYNDMFMFRNIPYTVTCLTKWWTLSSFGWWLTDWPLMHPVKDCKVKGLITQ